MYRPYSNLPKPLLALECLILCVGIPSIVAYFDLIKYMFSILWVCAFYAVWCTWRMGGSQPVWRPKMVAIPYLIPALARFAASVAVLGIYTYYFEREHFLRFVSEKPLMWAGVMVLYPLLSALPQEVIFRVFFFRRYGELFSGPTMMLLASAATFGYAHIVFENWIAVILTTIGGFFFALTYYRTRSLLLVTIEHAIYGNFIFTIGLGWYFYHGAVGGH